MQYNIVMNPKYLDNINNKVIDDLCVEIRRGSKISMVAASFSIYAYQALKKELSQVDEFRFIFTGNAFAKKKQPNEPREFYIPRLDKERNLYGTDYEIKLKNELNQQVIAKECAGWIRAKAKFRSNLENQPPSTPPFMEISNVDGSGVVYNSFENLGITFEEKAFYDILIAVAEKYGFKEQLSDDTYIFLAKEIQKLVGNKSKHTDWTNRQDVKDELYADVAKLLKKNGYPPKTINVAYDEIMKQVENYKQNAD